MCQRPPQTVSLVGIQHLINNVDLKHNQSFGCVLSQNYLLNVSESMVCLGQNCVSSLIWKLNFKKLKNVF